VTEKDIISLIPQKPPFVMVDKLVSCEEMRATTNFQVAQDNIMVSDGEFTEGGLMENMAQTAAAGAGYNAGNRSGPVSGYIVAVKNFEVFALPKVNDILTTTVEKVGCIFDMNMISGTVTCNNLVLAKCEMSIFEGNDA
jgi:predicted hotdog family 3-hydroxylacyl-ACP dehydratase